MGVIYDIPPFLSLNFNWALYLPPYHHLLLQQQQLHITTFLHIMAMINDCPDIVV